MLAVVTPSSTLWELQTEKEILRPNGYEALSVSAARLPIASLIGALGKCTCGWAVVRCSPTHHTTTAVPISGAQHFQAFGFF